MTMAMPNVKPPNIDVEDVEYIRHGQNRLLARVHKPRGEGPFPALVECHGGGWCVQDRLTEKLRHEAWHRVNSARFPLGK
jgi:acetyl esterase/lipase